MSKKLARLKFFLARGPAYHLAYLRWRGTQFLQRIARPGYNAELTAPDARDKVNVPAFFFTEGELDSLLQRIRDSTQNATIAAADRIVAREFEFRGSGPVRLAEKIDWTAAPNGNKDWLWDLNRHAWFETLGRAWRYSGDERYALAFADYLSNWLKENPPAVDASNWSSPFEVGFRINSWTWAYFLFANATVIGELLENDLRRGIGTHCKFLNANLELHARNNHLLLEAKALLFGGLLFPEFRDARQWVVRGERLLFREIRNQVLPDGVHGEMSTHYHRIIAGESLELYLLYRLQQRTMPADIAHRIQAMAEFEACITRPDGMLPLFGDSSQRDTYARFSAARAGSAVYSLPAMPGDQESATEAEIWRLGSATSATTRFSSLESRAFPDGGYYLMQSGARCDDAMYMAIDCGPFGLASDPHHGHADALSFELFAFGRPWLVDSGVFSTHADWAWRRYFRGTRSHNTVQVDDEDQSQLLDSRRAAPLARATCRSFTTGADVDSFDGSHDGYTRLSDAVTHRRRIWFRRGRYWLIVDHLSGRGEHKFACHFHCPSDVRAELIPNHGATLHAPGSRQMHMRYAANVALEARIECGNEQPIQGWRSIDSGQKSPAPTIVLQSICRAPFVLVTLLQPANNRDTSVPRLALLESAVVVEADDTQEHYPID